MVRFDKPDTFPENLRLAIVSDDTAWADAVVKHFKDIGRSAIAVENAEELQSSLDEKSVDVIVLDQPSDDVWDFCFQAQRQSDLMSPVLAVIHETGEETREQSERWTDRGADITFPSVAKDPVDVEDFLRAYFSKIPDYDK